MEVEVKRTYLRMTSPAQLRAFDPPPHAAPVEQVRDCPVSFYRWLYCEVGRNYHWVDRLEWTDEQVRSHLQQPALTLYVMYVGGVPAGWYELVRQPDGSVQIAYFGLLAEFHGRGLGKYLLTCAVRQAWQLGASSVWLHTCSLDDAAALPNYLRRGFEPYQEETYTISPPA